MADNSATYRYQCPTRVGLEVQGSSTSSPTLVESIDGVSYFNIIKENLAISPPPHLQALVPPRVLGKQCCCSP